MCIMTTINIMTELIFTKEEFGGVKTKAEEGYKNVVEVHCPYLNDKIAFNAKGLDHIKLKRWNHGRNEGDQLIRLKLLHLAPEIIKKSHTLQGIDQGNRMERIKVNSRWESRMTNVSYHEFIGVISGCRIKVIVKKVGDSPYWKQSDYRKKMFEGNPEED